MIMPGMTAGTVRVLGKKQDPRPRNSNFLTFSHQKFTNYASTSE